MNRLIMGSEGRPNPKPLKLKPSIPAEIICQDETWGDVGGALFLSAPNGDPLMAFWSADFEEWSVYYSE